LPLSLLLFFFLFTTLRLSLSQPPRITMPGTKRSRDDAASSEPAADAACPQPAADAAAAAAPPSAAAARPPLPPRTLLSLPADILRLIAERLDGISSDRRGWESLMRTCRQLRAECMAVSTSLSIPAAYPSRSHIAALGETHRERTAPWTVDELDADGEPPSPYPSDASEAPDSEEEDGGWGGEVQRRRTMRRPPTDPVLYLTPGRCEALRVSVDSLTRWVPKLNGAGSPVTTLRLGHIPSEADKSGVDAMFYGMVMGCLSPLPLTVLVVEGFGLPAFLHRPLPAARLTTLRIVGYVVDDASSALALPYLLRAHGETLRNFSVGFHTRNDAPAGSDGGTEERIPSGLVAAWLAASAHPPQVEAPPPLFGLSPPPLRAAPLLPSLASFALYGSPLGGRDVAALVTMCPALTKLYVRSELQTGCFEPLRTPGTLPRLSAVILWGTAHTLWHDLPDLLVGRALARLVLPTDHQTELRGVIDALRQAAALPSSLVLSHPLKGYRWLHGFRDSELRRLVGLDDPRAVGAAAVGLPARAGPRAPPPPVVDTSTLRTLTVSLSRSSTWASMDALAALPSLASLSLDLTFAKRVVGVGQRWPAFPALTEATLSWGDSFRSLSGTMIAFFRGLAPPLAADAPPATGEAGSDGGGRPAGGRLRRLTIQDESLQPSVSLLRRDDWAGLFGQWRALDHLAIRVASAEWLRPPRPSRPTAATATAAAADRDAAAADGEGGASAAGAAGGAGADEAGGSQDTSGTDSVELVVDRLPRGPPASELRAWLAADVPGLRVTTGMLTKGYERDPDAW